MMKLKNLLFAAFLMCSHGLLLDLVANPVSGKVVYGEASFEQDEKILQIHAGDGTIIEWKSFSNLKSEKIDIILPTSSDAILMRVNSDLPSEIQGSLTSNGRVFLINPSGLIFGNESSITCQEFLGSTLDSSNQEFIDGPTLRFEGHSKGVIANDGQLKCHGNIFLLGKALENRGKLISETKNVYLAAGDSVWMAAEESPQVIVTSIDATAAIENRGNIIAADVELLASGGEANPAIITNQGIIVAQTVDELPGKILLKANRGAVFQHDTLTASSGNVTIEGDLVELAEGSLIDVSGKTGGGKIHVGGGWQGQDPSIQNARITKVVKGAVLQADAINEGSGGTVVVWADQATVFDGSINAMGKGAGPGGNVEVSTKNYLCFNGYVNLSAESGVSGHLLLDPTSITIQSANPDIDGNGTNQDITSTTQLDNATTTPTGFPNANSIITSGAVNGLLGTNVSMTLAAQQFITVNSPITASGTGATLTLEAPTVNLNQPITLPGGGVLNGVGVNTVNVGTSGNAQNGINVSSSGATVNLAAATYPGQLVIQNKNLTLNGQGMGSTIVECPLATALPTQNSVNPVIFAQGGTAINIQNLTVNGNYVGFPTNADITGIDYLNAAGTLTNLHITQVANDPPPFGTGQQGFGIRTNVTAGAFTWNISQSLIDNFGKEAMRLNGTGLTVNVNACTVTGAGVQVDLGSNGIQLSNGATGTITNCSVSGIQFDGATSAGILLFANDSNTTVSNNIVLNNDEGIVAVNSGSGLLIQGNTCEGNGDCGIYVQDTSGPTQLISNLLSNNGAIAAPGNPKAGMYLLNTVAQELFQITDNTFIGDPNQALFVQSTGVGADVDMSGNVFTNP